MNCTALAPFAARLRKFVCCAGFAALTAGLAFNVNVSAAPTALAACVATLTPGGIEVGARGAAGLSFGVAIAPGCAYNVVSNSPFIVVTSAASGVGSGSVSFMVQPNSGLTRRSSIAVAGLTFTVKQAKRTSVAAAPFDFDGDGKSDIGVYRPSSGTWFVLQSLAGSTTSVQFGFGADKLVPADYDGDGKADVAIYRPSNGTWYSLGTTSGFTATQFGFGNDIPVPGDYDGDGKTDIGVYRPSTGTWYLLRSSAGFSATQYGVGADVPLPSVYLRR